MLMSTGINGTQLMQTSVNQAEVHANNDKMILAQINMCRFLFRLSKLAVDSDITESAFLKEKLVFMILKNIMIKISSLNRFNEGEQNPLNLLEWTAYSKTEGFKRMQLVIAEYYQKYSSYYHLQQEKGLFSSVSIREELAKDKKFEAVFDHNFLEFESFYIILQSFLRVSIREINHAAKNRVKSEGEELQHSTEQSIVLLDYLITYFQLTNLVTDHFTDYLYFAENSKIEQIAEGRPVKLNKSHYAQIRNKIYTLNI